jgi:hypothetical protein
MARHGLRQGSCEPLAIEQAGEPQLDRKGCGILRRVVEVVIDLERRQRKRPQRIRGGGRFSFEGHPFRCRLL